MPDWVQCAVGGVKGGRFLPRLFLDSLTQEDLARHLPNLMSYSTGGQMPQFGSDSHRPEWWPTNVQWKKPWPGIGPSAQCLRELIWSLYHHHGQSHLIITDRRSLQSAMPAMMVNLVTSGHSHDTPSRYTNLQPLDFNANLTLKPTRETASMRETASYTDMYVCFFCEAEFVSKSAVVQHQQQCVYRPSQLHPPSPTRSWDHPDTSSNAELPTQMRVPKTKFVRHIGLVPIQKAQSIRTRASRESVDLDCQIIAVIPVVTPKRLPTPSTPLLSSSLMSQLKRKSISGDDNSGAFTATGDGACHSEDLRCTPTNVGHPVSLSVIDLTSPLGLRVRKQMALTSQNFYITKDPEAFCRTLSKSKNSAHDKLRARFTIFTTTFRMTTKMRRRHNHEISFSRREREEKYMRLKTGLSEESRKLMRFIRPCSVVLKRLSKHDIDRDTEVPDPQDCSSPLDDFPSESILVLPEVDELLGLKRQKPSPPGLSRELQAELSKLKLTIYRSLLTDHSLYYSNLKCGGEASLVRRLIHTSTVLYNGINSESASITARTDPGTSSSPGAGVVRCLITDDDEGEVVENDREMFSVACHEQTYRKESQTHSTAFDQSNDASRPEKRSRNEMDIIDVINLDEESGDDRLDSLEQSAMGEAPQALRGVDRSDDRTHSEVGFNLSGVLHANVSAGSSERSNSDKRKQRTKVGERLRNALYIDMTEKYAYCPSSSRVRPSKTLANERLANLDTVLSSAKRAASSGGVSRSDALNVRDNALRSEGEALRSEGEALRSEGEADCSSDRLDSLERCVVDNDIDISLSFEKSQRKWRASNTTPCKRKEGLVSSQKANDLETRLSSRDSGSGLNDIAPCSSTSNVDNSQRHRRRLRFDSSETNDSGKRIRNDAEEPLAKRLKIVLKAADSQRRLGESDSLTTGRGLPESAKSYQADVNTSPNRVYAIQIVRSSSNSTHGCTIAEPEVRGARRENVRTLRSHPATSHLTVRPDHDPPTDGPPHRVEPVYEPRSSANKRVVEKRRYSNLMARRGRKHIDWGLFSSSGNNSDSSVSEQGLVERKVNSTPVKPQDVDSGRSDCYSVGMVRMARVDRTSRGPWAIVSGNDDDGRVASKQKYGTSQDPICID